MQESDLTFVRKMTGATKASNAGKLFVCKMTKTVTQEQQMQENDTTFFVKATTKVTHGTSNRTHLIIKCHTVTARKYMTRHFAENAHLWLKVAFYVNCLHTCFAGI
jgi:hypothetical protein